jgi:hypothetical protein
VVEKQRWVRQSVVGVNSNFKQTTLKEIKTKTLQVGVKFSWPLLGFVGFQKSEQLNDTERSFFSQASLGGCLWN